MVFSSAYLVEIKRLTSVSRNQKVVILEAEILQRQIELLGRFGEALSLPKRWLKIKACLA